MDKVTALKQSPLLAALDERQLQGLASVAKERHFDAGDKLISAGTKGGLAMFVLLSGRVEISKNGVFISDLGPGAHVGEMAVLGPDDMLRSADVIASEPTTTLQVTRWDLYPYLKSNPEAALVIINELAGRLALADEKLASQSDLPSA